VEAIAAPAHDTSELESLFAAQARAPNGGLIVMPDAFMAAPQHCCPLHPNKQTLDRTGSIRRYVP
jgi:hypothetical protein